MDSLTPLRRWSPLSSDPLCERRPLHPLARPPRQGLWAGRLSGLGQAYRKGGSGSIAPRNLRRPNSGLGHATHRSTTVYTLGFIAQRVDEAACPRAPLET